MNIDKGKLLKAVGYFLFVFTMLALTIALVLAFIKKII